MAAEGPTQGPTEGATRASARAVTRGVTGGTHQQLLTFTVRDKGMLQLTYMGFVKYGGLFIASPREFHLGDAVFILLSFNETGERYSVPGRVIWITPRGAPNKRPQGVGVQFQPPEAIELQKKIEAMLAGRDASHPTLTL